MKILIADDHAIIRSGIKLRLSQWDDDLIFFEADNFESARQVIADNILDFAIIDLYMPGMNKEKSISAFKQANPQLPIIVFSNEENASTITAILKEDIAGYIPKSEASEIIIKAIELILAGGKYIPSHIIRQFSQVQHPLKNNELVETLSTKQKELINYICAGHPNKRIATNMNLSQGTVKQYIHQLYKFFSVSSRSELQKYLRDTNYFDE